MMGSIQPFDAEMFLKAAVPADIPLDSRARLKLDALIVGAAPILAKNPERSEEARISLVKLIQQLELHRVNSQQALVTVDQVDLTMSRGFCPAFPFC
jgi:hypothetical protein